MSEPRNAATAHEEIQKRSCHNCNGIAPCVSTLGSSARTTGKDLVYTRFAFCEKCLRHWLAFFDEKTDDE
jgi:hypothetical protein